MAGKTSYGNRLCCRNPHILRYVELNKHFLMQVSKLSHAGVCRLARRDGKGGTGAESGRLADYRNE